MGEIKRKKMRRKVGGSVINRCGLIKRRIYIYIYLIGREKFKREKKMQKISGLCSSMIE